MITKSHTYILITSEQLNATQIDGASNFDEDLNETVTSIEELHLDSSDVTDYDTDNEAYPEMRCDLCNKGYFDETLLMEHRLLCHADSLDEYLNEEPTEELYPEEIFDQLDGHPGSPSEISESEYQQMSHENSDAEMRDASEENQVATNSNVSILFDSCLLYYTIHITIAKTIAV